MEKRTRENTLTPKQEITFLEKTYNVEHIGAEKCKFGGKNNGYELYEFGGKNDHKFQSCVEECKDMDTCLGISFTTNLWAWNNCKLHIIKNNKKTDNYGPILISQTM